MNDQAADPSKKPYHHGDLRKALLVEAERMLEAEGMPGLTLRAIARNVGVSPAAPSKHFGDLGGLLSDLAAEGHLRMDAELLARMADASDPMSRAFAMGEGYVDFAVRHPGLFTLMYRSERLDLERPALKAALDKKRQLAPALLAGRPGHSTRPAMMVAAQATALWSLVHGYAVLLLEGRLERTLAMLPEPQTPQSYLRLVLQSVTLSQ